MPSELPQRLSRSPCVLLKFVSLNFFLQEAPEGKKKQAYSTIFISLIVDIVICTSFYSTINENLPNNNDSPFQGVLMSHLALARR